MRATVILPFVAAILAGLAAAMQPPTNALLARASGSVWLASLISFTVGTSILLLLWFALDRTGLGSVRAAPASAWLGGLYGVIFVCAGAFAAPRIGLATTLAILVTCQLGGALALDHFGLLGLTANPFGWRKAIGVASLLFGVVLVRG